MRDIPQCENDGKENHEESSKKITGKRNQKQQQQQQKNQIKIFSPPHPLTIPKSPAFASKLLEKSKSNIQQQQQPSSKITAVSTKVNL